MLTQQKKSFREGWSDDAELLGWTHLSQGAGQQCIGGGAPMFIPMRGEKRPVQGTF